MSLMESRSPGSRPLLRLLSAQHVWVKLAGADRITRASGGLRDAIPFMQALAAAAPQRVVWGSDCPHIGFHSELLEVLNEAVPGEQARRLILVDNPATLYGFDLNPPGRRRS
jgi:predicted TIM-barrel fold metal-dependent hydrolase